MKFSELADWSPFTISDIESETIYVKVPKGKQEGASKAYNAKVMGGQQHLFTWIDGDVPVDPLPEKIVF